MILTNSGVVWGKYGRAEMLEERVKQLRDWQNDENEKVKGFYNRFSEANLKLAQEERKRVDDEEELRKAEFEV